MPSKKLIKIVTLLLISTFIYNLIKQESFSQDLNNYTSSQNEFTKGSEISSEYILGPGDGVLIIFSGLNLFSGTYIVNENGFLTLPEIDKVFANKKTLRELRIELEKKYRPYIINPEIKLQVVNYRDINVYISGEVQKPGLYTLKYKKNNFRSSYSQNTLNDFSNNSLSINETSVSTSPKLFEALKISEGLTNFADLSKVKVVRNVPNSMGGNKIETTIDFLQLIKNGDQTKNIRLMDGDYIMVPKTDKLLKKQILEINKTNLTPDKIIIYISGNVRNPGQKLLPQGVTLSQAIATAGGESYFTGKIKHLRFDEMGNTEKNIFYFDANKKVNSKSNPILLSGDIIEVNRTIVGKTFRAIQEVVPPILTGYGLYSIFN